MNTISDEGGAGRRRRRNHSVAFKAQVVAACRPAGVSIAAVALAHGINANLARRWVLDAERIGVAAVNVAAPGFVPLQLPPPDPAPADIRIELRHGATTVNVSWPAASASDCAVWMRELLR